MESRCACMHACTCIDCRCADYLPTASFVPIWRLCVEFQSSCNSGCYGTRVVRPKYYPVQSWLSRVRVQADRPTAAVLPKPLTKKWALLQQVQGSAPSFGRSSGEKPRSSTSAWPRRRKETSSGGLRYLIYTCAHACG